MNEKKQITYREYTKRFIQYLKKYGVLKRFKQEYLRQHPYNFTTLYHYINPLTTYPLSTDIQRGRIGDVIDHAFTWSESKEGHDFWSSLNDNWKHRAIHEKELVPEKLMDTFK